jgi:prepilin-type processing-associated H-X9-DG protein
MAPSDSNVLFFDGTVAEPVNSELAEVVSITSNHRRYESED